MIDYQKIQPDFAIPYQKIMENQAERGCEYSFVNLSIWGRQEMAFVDCCVTVFSQFERRSLYLYPVGRCDIRPVLDAIIADAKEKRIVCRLTGLSADDCVKLEEAYPGKFQFHPDRDSCDYVYRIEDLATLNGRKYQKKRNHLNKFRKTYPNHRIAPITHENMGAVQEMVDRWYTQQLAMDPGQDFHLEQRAIRRAFAHWDELGVEGLALYLDEEVVGMTIGSRLSKNTFDIHFEKALEDIDGAYPAINQAFAAYLWEKYPELEYLNREDDMGIPGLRKAKLSYQPHHLVVKFWARLWEDEDED